MWGGGGVLHSFAVAKNIPGWVCQSFALAKPILWEIEGGREPLSPPLDPPMRFNQIDLYPIEIEHQQYGLLNGK